MVIRSPPHIRYDAQGLIQISRLEYTLGSRTWSESYRFSLPLPLTQPLWKRYKYSLTDVSETLQCYPTRILYQLAAMLGIRPSVSSTRGAFHTCRHLVHSSKSIVLGKLRGYYNTLGPWPVRSVLGHNPNDPFQPRLPVVWASAETVAHLITQIPAQVLISERPVWQKAWTFQDVQMVPLAVTYNQECHSNDKSKLNTISNKNYNNSKTDKSNKKDKKDKNKSYSKNNKKNKNASPQSNKTWVRAARIVPSRVFYQTNRPTCPPVSRPWLATVNGEDVAVLLEDSCWIAQPRT